MQPVLKDGDVLESERQDTWYFEISANTCEVWPLCQTRQQANS